MRIVDLDYSPLRRAVSTRGYAKSAELLPQRFEIQKSLWDINKKSLDINSRLLRLQEKDLEASRTANLINTIAGITTAGLSIIESIGRIIEQKQLQEAKPMAYAASNEIAARMTEARINGEFKIVKDEQGNYVIPETPERVTEVMNKWKAVGKEKEFWSNAQGFLDDSLNQAFYSAVGAATDEAIVQAARDRDAAFQQGVTLATQESIATRSMDPVVSQVQSAEWLTDDAKQTLIAQSEHDILMGSTINDLTAITKSEGSQKALTAFESVQGNFSDAEQKHIRSVIAQTDKDTFSTAFNDVQQKFLNLITPKRDELGNIVTEGVSRAEAISVLEETFSGREADKPAIIEALRKDQSIGEWNDAYALFNQDRDDLLALHRDYLELKEGALSQRFDGIPEDHKSILDLFDKQIKYLEAKDEGSDADRIAKLNSDMAFTYEAWETETPDPQTGLKPSTQAAIARMYQYIEQGGNTNKAFEYIGKMRSGNKAIYAPIFSELEQFYDTQIKGIKDPVAKGEATRRREESLAMLSAMAGKSDVSYDELSKSVQRVKELEVANSLKDVRFILDTGAMDRFGSSDFGKVLQAAQTGILDDLVYVDSQGNTRFARGKATVQQLMSLSEQMLIEAGAPIKTGTSQFVKKGSDVGAEWTVKGTDGKTYAVRTFDGGKTARPAVLQAGSWVDITPQRTVETSATTEQQIKQEQSLEVKTKNVALQQIEGIENREDRLDEIRKYINIGAITWEELEEAGYDRQGNRKPSWSGARGGGR